MDSLANGRWWYIFRFYFRFLIRIFRPSMRVVIVPVASNTSNKGSIVEWRLKLHPKG